MGFVFIDFSILSFGLIFCIFFTNTSSFKFFGCNKLILFVIALYFSGSVLTRSAVSNTVLIDQNGENYPLHSEMADATIVSFIFTRCHDVCPTITQNLKTTQNQLSDEDVAFISISVDPDYDTPERLKEYTELHGVDWPHLTSDNITLEGVWDEFLVRVDRAYIESHGDTDDDSGDHSHHHGHDETDHDEMVS